MFNFLSSVSNIATSFQSKLSEKDKANVVNNLNKKINVLAEKMKRAVDSFRIDEFEAFKTTVLNLS